MTGTSNATARRRGKDWERQVREYSRKAGFDYEQLRETGAKDEGDGVIRLPGGTYLVIEAKNTQKLDLGPHLNEAQVEAANFRLHRDGLRGLRQALGVLFQKRRGKGTGEAYAVMTVDDFFSLIGAMA